MATCAHHNTIPDDVLVRIPGSQAGSGRHRCVICAYAQGVAAARRGATIRSLGETETCNHGSEAPSQILRKLQESQAGGGRHKCCTCAFQLGFLSLTAEIEAQTRADVETEDASHGVESRSGHAEGCEVFRQSRTYERDPRNRAAAIRAHGNTCVACGYNFDTFYGAAYARSYIEVHHLNPLAGGVEREVDPVTDLCPLCANCHSMAHRRPGTVLSIEDLRRLIEQARAHNAGSA
ncbi:MAG TPA: HNH endonuclease [Verrucomicrobiota bacterium]|nr:HNH endonuclease [Verrucomicrobiota bacterium]